MIDWIRANLWITPFLLSICFLPFCIAFMVEDKEICIHKYVKIENKPHEEYWDYSGYHVGVFKCQCGKCGKIKDRKYY